MEVETFKESAIRKKDLYHQLIPKPKPDLCKIPNKNIFAKELVRSAHEFTKPVTKTSSKIQDPKSLIKLSAISSMETNGQKL